MSAQPVQSPMTIVAELFEHVVGIDTHARTHAYCLVHSRSGAVVASASFPTSKSGNTRAIGWIVHRTQGSVLAAVEGTSSYGAGITAALSEEGFEVAEVRPAARTSHAHAGKSDALDAEAAARSSWGVTTTSSPGRDRPDGASHYGYFLLPARSSISSEPPTATRSTRCCAASTSASTPGRR